MSDDNELTPEAADSLASLLTHDTTAKALSGPNKAALFAALRQNNVATITVSFDGAGDSGQIEEVIAFDESNTIVALPDARVDIAILNFRMKEPRREALTLADAIEQVCYDILEAAHAGWEINDGAFGEFTFNSASQTITLDFNYRRSEHSSELF